MSQEPTQIWWSPAEIAAARLPDMPSTARRVTAMAERNGWRSQPDHARRRSGKGGGWEYHWSLLPMAAQQQLTREALDAPAAKLAPVMERSEAWTYYDGLPETAKAKAEARLRVIQRAEMIRNGGTIMDLAVYEAAQAEGVSARSVWNWIGLIEGIATHDRLAYLAPRHRAAPRPRDKAEVTPEAWDFLKSDYLRFEQPSFTACYRRAVRVASANGWVLGSEPTMRRRLHAEVSKASQVLARKGQDALARMYPAQTRDKTALHALEAVNADYHRFDVFVRWPADAGAPEGEIVRPQMCAFQDIYSGMILSWKLDKTPNRVGVSLALGDMIDDYGIPDHVLFDNGREFANKFLTGGVPTRYRFKVKEDDIPGILVTLGCKVHWAQPYSGQSKPIERAFRDMCDDIAKDPRLAGAYTGNRPDAKPENYGDKAIDLEDFLKVLAEGIAEHNARDGRRSETANGRSLLQTFQASYERSPIKRATPEQRRLWLMGAEGVTCRKGTGAIWTCRAFVPPQVLV